MTGARPSEAGPNRAVSRTSAAWPGSVTPGGGPAGVILPNSAAAFTGDWSARSSVTSAAWPESIARTSLLLTSCGNAATGMACCTPGNETTAAAWAADSGSLASTRTSAPALNAAWS